MRNGCCRVSDVAELRVRRASVIVLKSAEAEMREEG
jgi:hypothetical protein